MAGAQQPYMYSPEKKDDDRFPSVPFDPKAVTRASIEPKPKKKAKRKGPLIAFNQHPDSHVVPTPRSVFWKPITGRTKWWIKALRTVQLMLRIIQLNAAVGLLVLVILITHMADMTAWVMRILPGVVAIQCVYGIVHLCRPAGGRTPGSSAAYHTFATISDISVMPLLGYGALSARKDGSKWHTLLSNQDIMPTILSTYYWLLVADCCLHFLTFLNSAWLSLMFRRIYKMPPDMNPLENHLTSRQHKRNKSSVATSTYSAVDNRASVQVGDLARPPQVPFMRTRGNSDVSVRSSQINLPSRHYQITPGNSPHNSPRNSAASSELKRASAPPAQQQPQQSSSFKWGTYTEIPTNEQHASRPSSPRPDSSHARFSTGTVPSYRPSPTPPVHQVVAQSAQPREAKFTEAWYASESLVNRTQERARALNQLNAANNRRAYEALSQPYDNYDSDDASDSDRENVHDSENYTYYGRGRSSVLIGPDSEDHDYAHDENDLGNAHHPNPLRSNPMGNASGNLARTKTPYYPRGGRTSIDAAALADVNLNDRRVSGNSGLDIADERLAPPPQAPPHSSSSSPAYYYEEQLQQEREDEEDRDHQERQSQLHRNSSIQSESNFYSKPYGALKAATPPIVIGAGRQVSSGNDYASAMDERRSVFGRRGVSGKIAEEGRVFL